MTLRDYFAAKAMQGIMSKEVRSIWLNEKTVREERTNAEIIAENAYFMADVMIAERNKLEKD